MPKKTLNHENVYMNHWQTIIPERLIKIIKKYCFFQIKCTGRIGLIMSVDFQKDRNRHDVDLGACFRFLMMVSK